jgi:hypothetical protein
MHFWPCIVYLRSVQSDKKPEFYRPKANTRLVLSKSTLIECEFIRWQFFQNYSASYTYKKKCVC